MRKKLPQRIDNILKEIRDELKKIYRGRLKEVILFGSYARGDFKEESDIDIILLLKSLKDVSLERQKYFPVISKISLKHDVVVTVVPFDFEVFQKKRTPLIMNVTREGIRV